MVGFPPARDDDEARLTDARGEFVASLPRRLEVLRSGLVQLGEAPSERERLNGMLRRLHALASSARVLGFASVAEVLAEAERTLRKAPRSGPSPVMLKEVARGLDLLPSLVLGAPNVRQVSPPAEAVFGYRSAPISVLVFGPQTLASAFAAEVGAHFELERTQDAERFMELARTSAPDAIVLDLDESAAKELLAALRSDPLIERSPVIGVGSFATPEAAAVFAAAGAHRVLAKPVSPEILRRALLELGELAERSRTQSEPLGELSVEELAERISAEVKKGLIESLESRSPARVQFGDGADVLGAVWGAVARVRELVTLRSAGNLRFQPYGPEGAIPLAPWVNDDRRAGERGSQPARGADDVALKGRRIVIADDDPAVVWFLSGLLKAVGAEVLEAHDGERALERVFESWPDLVVSDVLMPRRDGFSLCHEIKRDVAVRDVPVILLSWKEDLLQRVRELGATADGYLRKEATASTVVERVREVLRPRARIEQRLRVGGEVRGRLDGITPRLVLELVGKWCPDSTVTIRDAVYLYEAHVRGGRLRSITRSASDGSFERGAPVLAALLGVGAGRFVVQPDTTPCRGELEGSLQELFDEPVKRARAALAALTAERLPRVTKVELELELVSPYLDCTPDTARRLVKRLAAGDAPRDLLLSGEASAWLLEAVLSDLARRGAVKHVQADESRSSAPQPAEAESEVEETPAEPSRVSERARGREAPASADTGWSEPPAAPELAVASRTRASSEVVSDAVPAAAPPAPRPLAQPQSSSLERASQPPAEDAAWFSFQVETEPRSLPAVVEQPPSEAAAPPTQKAEADLGSAPAAAKPAVSPAAEDTESLFADLADSGPPAAPAPAAAAAGSSTGSGPQRDATLMGLGSFAEEASAAEERPDQGSRFGVRPVFRMPNAADAPSPSIADVFAAALADDIEIPAVSAPAASVERASTAGETEKEPSAAKDSEAAATKLETADPALAVSGPEPRRILEPAESALHLAPTPALGPVEPAPAPAARDHRASTLVSAGAPAFLSEVEGESASDGSAQPPAVKVVTLEHPSRSGAPGASTLVSERDSEPAAPAEKAEASEPAAAEPPKAEANAAQESELAAEKPAKSPKVLTVRAPSASGEPTAAKRPTQAKTAQPTPTPPPADAAPQQGAVLRTALLAGAAALAGYLVVSRVIVPWLAPPEVTEPTPSPSAIIAAVREPAAPSRPQITIEPVELPPGVDPGAGRGMLDVMGEPSDQLYVDGTFVGRGPGRSVPTSAGAHEVKIVRGDMAYSTQVDVPAGRRLRARLGAHPPPRPSR